MFGLLREDVEMGLNGDSGKNKAATTNAVAA